MTTDAQSIGSLLFSHDSQSAALMAQAHVMQKYQRALEEWPAGGGMGALRVVNLRQGTLVIHADNGSALTTLRFHLNDLLTYLRTRGYQCAEIEAKVAPRPARGQGGV